MGSPAVKGNGNSWARWTSEVTALSAPWKSPALLRVKGNAAFNLALAPQPGFSGAKSILPLINQSTFRIMKWFSIHLCNRLIDWSFSAAAHTRP